VQRISNKGELWAIAGFFGMTVEMLEQVYGHHMPEHCAAVHEAIG